MTGGDKVLSTFCVCHQLHESNPWGVFQLLIHSFVFHIIWLHIIIFQKGRSDAVSSVQIQTQWICILITNGTENSFLSASLFFFSSLNTFDLLTKNGQLGHTSFLIHQALYNETMKRLTMRCIKDGLQRKCIFQFFRSCAVMQITKGGWEERNKGLKPLQGKHLSAATMFWPDAISWAAPCSSKRREIALS